MAMDTFNKGLEIKKNKPTAYTVIKGDCLWNIAKKEKIYGDPFQWPKIYKENKDQIRDPDLIFPKQVFRIPR
ncbi:LysM peptidoglycan-binding domain-containing protein [bacterium]|nr:LysM peptidoglycan-binding domain-containing protein [bacterium]